MTYEEFRNAVSQEVSKRFGYGYEVECIPDGWGKGEDIISVYNSNLDFSTADTLKEYYELYNKGISVEAVAKRIDEVFRPEFE